MTEPSSKATPEALRTALSFFRVTAIIALSLIHI